jgi:hypothetical protein
MMRSTSYCMSSRSTSPSSMSQEKGFSSGNSSNSLRMCARLPERNPLVGGGISAQVVNLDLGGLFGMVEGDDSGVVPDAAKYNSKGHGALVVRDNKTAVMLVPPLEFKFRARRQADADGRAWPHDKRHKGERRCQAPARPRRTWPRFCRPSRVSFRCGDGGNDAKAGRPSAEPADAQSLKNFYRCMWCDSTFTTTNSKPLQPRPLRAPTEASFTESVSRAQRRLNALLTRYPPSYYSIAF